MSTGTLFADSSIVAPVLSPPLMPPLKWAGGKRWQVSHIRPLWLASGAQRLVEPFCGGLSVALGLQPRRALLNDVNPHLMNFYHWVQRGQVGVVPTDNDADSFYRHRDRFNALARDRERTPEAAALFFYLNHTGFNGLCRFNNSGGFNVPYGKRKSVNYEREWADYAAQFSGWEFTCGDFDRVKLHSGDFVYADPPYDVEFTTYSAGGFKWADQVRAAEWLAKHDGPVVLVNQRTERIETLYRSLGYDIEYLAAPRRIRLQRRPHAGQGSLCDAQYSDQPLGHGETAMPPTVIEQIASAFGTTSFRFSVYFALGCLVAVWAIVVACIHLSASPKVES